MVGLIPANLTKHEANSCSTIITHSVYRWILRVMFRYFRTLCSRKGLRSFFFSWSKYQYSHSDANTSTGKNIHLTQRDALCIMALSESSRQQIIGCPAAKCSSNVPKVTTKLAQGTQITQIVKKFQGKFQFAKTNVSTQSRWSQDKVQRAVRQPGPGVSVTSDSSVSNRFL